MDGAPYVKEVGDMDSCRGCTGFDTYSSVLAAIGSVQDTEQPE